MKSRDTLLLAEAHRKTALYLLRYDLINGIRLIKVPPKIILKRKTQLKKLSYFFESVPYRKEYFVYLLEQKLVKVVRGWEDRQTVRHEQPASLIVCHQLVAPRLIHQLTQYLISQPLVADTLETKNVCIQKMQNNSSSNKNKSWPHYRELRRELILGPPTPTQCLVNPVESPQFGWTTSLKSDWDEILAQEFEQIHPQPFQRIYIFHFLKGDLRFGTKLSLLV